MKLTEENGIKPSLLSMRGGWLLCTGPKLLFLLSHLKPSTDIGTNSSQLIITDAKNGRAQKSLRISTLNISTVYRNHA